MVPLLKDEMGWTLLKMPCEHKDKRGRSAEPVRPRIEIVMTFLNPVMAQHHPLDLTVMLTPVMSDEVTETHVSQKHLDVLVVSKLFWQEMPGHSACQRTTVPVPARSAGVSSVQSWTATLQSNNMFPK